MAATKQIKTALVSVFHKDGLDEPQERKEDIVYEEVKSEDVKLVESSWKKVIQKIKEDKKLSIAALLREVSSFNVKDNILYLIFLLFPKDLAT